MASLRVCALRPDLVVATLLWKPNGHSLPFSRMYDETWVEKLYRGFARNLTVPFEFVCFVGEEREFAEPITQLPIGVPSPSYSECILPFMLNRPMILCGLDTVVTGDCDHLADYCLKGGHLAAPLDPYNASQVCNGVTLVGPGRADIWENHAGQNDMEWIRMQGPAILDELWPGHVVSYKGHVKGNGLGDARIVYFHGEEKPHQIEADWIEEHWNGADMATKYNHPNLLPGEPVKGMSGWKAKEKAARERLKKNDPAERERIRAIRAAHYAKADVSDAATVEPAKADTAPAEPVKDFVSEMNDEDLHGYYEAACGKAPHHKMKRATVEAKVREALNGSDG